MRRPRSFILLLMMTLSSPFAFATAKSTFNQIRPLIFQIKTSSSSNLGKSSYGTGFVVDRSGLLITNYHVIADSIWHERNNRVFIEINGKALPVEIRAVDFVRDLAVVAVAHDFKSQISIAQNMPNHGDSIYSLGLPADVDWTIISGVYNGTVTRGPFESIHMSTPLNPGMSGGPTVNSRNELVAVNVSGLSDMQQISFGIPVRFVREILTRAKTKVLSSDEMISQLNEQLLDLQTKMTTQILAAFAKPKVVDELRLPDFGKNVRCWGRAGSDQKAPRFIGQGESCSLEHSVALLNGQFSGTFDARSVMMKNESLSLFSWYRLIGLGWNPSHEIVPSFDSEAKLHYNQHRCYRERVKNTLNELRTVNLCLQQMNPLTNLYDAYLQVFDAQAPRRFAGASLSLAGFTLDNIRKISATVINHSFVDGKP